MFGSTSFGSQPSTFGSFTSAANTTTASVFGQQPQTNTTMPLFGGGTTTVGFNSPLKQTTFGSSTFGSASALQTPLFGAQPNRIAPVSGTTGVFNQTSTMTPFMQGQAQGTSVPFTPLSGTDTMMRNGQPQPINTRHQCISCMKEYDTKSLEELRLEDYQLGRKGTAQSGLFGATSGQQSSLFSGLGSSATSSTFGQPRTTAFGAPTVTSGGGLFSSLNQSKPTSLFSNTNTGTTFGSSFAFPTTTTQQSLFGQSTTSTAASTPFSFSQQPQQSGLFGAKPLTAPTTTTSAFSGFGSSNLGKPLGGIFTSTVSPFGSTTNTLGSTTAPTLFSQQPQNKPLQFQPFGSSFGATQPSTQLPFGQPSTSTFTFPTPTTSATTGLAFGTQPSSFGSFGTGSTAPSTGFPSFNSPSTSLGAPTASGTAFPSFSFPAQQQPTTGFSFLNNPSTNTTFFNASQTVPSTGPGPVPFATTPYKDSPLFYSLILSRNLEEMTKPTNPLAQRAIKEASKRRTSATQSTTVSSPPTLGNLTFPVSKGSVYSKASIFDGFEEDSRSASIDILSPKSSVKKLSLKNIQGISGLTYSGNSSLINTLGAKTNETGRYDLERTGPNASANDNFVIGLGCRDDSSSSVFRVSSGESLLAGHLPQEFDGNFQAESGLNGALPNGYAGGHRCQVVCTVPGYFIEPNVDELDCLTQDDGNCFVENFIVGRHNYGKIKFLEVVNVAGLNIDETVMFRHKETVVYPDDDVKPPVGEGINVPAEITMERVWPVDRTTREPIKSPSKIRSMNYEDKLRRSCKRMDAEYISYDYDLGVWTFKVKHFSKYSCVPEENEDDDAENVPPTSERPIQKAGLGGVSLQDLITSSAPTPVAQTPQLPEKAVTQIAVAKETPRECEAIFRFPTHLHRKLVLDSQKTLLEEKLLHAPINFTSNKTSNILGKKAKAGVPIRRYRKRAPVKLERIDQPFSMFSALSSDRFTLTSGARRGTRVSFGPKGYFVRVINMKTSGTIAFKGTTELLKLEPYVTKLQPQRLQQHLLTALLSQLDVHKQTAYYSETGKLSGDCLGTVASQVEMLNTIRRNTCTSDCFYDTTSLMGQEEQMWELCQILWPPDQVSSKFLCQFDTKFCLYQRKQLSDWIVRNSVSLFGDLTKVRDRKVTRLLKMGEKLKACEMAMADRNYTVALCLAQNNYLVNEVCDNQMLKWEQCGAEPYISSELKELYQLCSSCPLWNQETLRKMNSSEWFQHFAIFMWYLARSHWTISDVVNSYHHSIVRSLLPICDEENDDLCFPAESETEATIANLCICLLKAFSCHGYPMIKLLSPRTCGPDSLDYKISWLLMNNLMRFGFIIEESLYDSITNSFAGQLENLGYFEWAVFILKHCRPTQERDIFIRRILERNLTNLGECDIERENFLDSIGVPATEIECAKSMTALSLERKFGEVRYLLKSDHFNDAFEVLTKMLRNN